MIETRLTELRLAFMMLTRLPVGQIAGDAPPVGRSAWAWPLVGVITGALAAAVLALAHRAGLPPLVGAALALITGTLVTGGLHEDGLADTADGLGGGRTRERVLEIMRDSRIGSYGALAIGLSLMVRAGSLAELAPCALIAVAAASRAPMVLALHLMPPARSDGLGQGAAGVGRGAALVAVGLGTLALLPFGLSAALVTVTAMALTSVALGALARRRIGGQTGDICGAMQQLAEMAGLCALAAMMT